MRLRGSPAGLIVLALCGGCGDVPAAEPDARVDAGPLDAASDAAPGDARPDGGGALARDAAPLPCEAPEYYSPHAARFRYFHLSASGQPGHGLDVDENPATCAPAGDCGGGVDNQVATLHVEGCRPQPIDPGGFDYLLDLLMVHGRPPESWLLEARDLTMSGNDSTAPFALVMHHAQWYPSVACTGSASVLDDERVCDYLVDDEWLAWGTCSPFAAFENVEIQGGVLEGGDEATTILISYNLGGATAGLAIHRARIQADVTVAGNELTVTNGILAGVVCPRDLVSLLSTLVTSADPETCQMEQQMPDPDMEVGCSPGPGPDGISVAFRFEAYPASIVGLLRE